MQLWKLKPWPRNLNQTASGKPGAVQAHFNNVCDRMKAEGIEVFIFHVIGNASAEPYMRQCAGDNYVKVTGSSDWVNGMAMLAERGTEGLPRLVK